MKIKPFCAWRPLPGHEADVADVPYDVVDTPEAKARVDGRPWSILRITRPEVNFERSAPQYSPDEYDTAARLFNEWCSSAPVIRDETPSFSVYRLRWGQHEQCGIVACLHRDDYLNNRIRVHERTRHDKEQDRTRHIAALRADTGPVFLMHRGSDSLRALTVAATGSAPFSHLVADGVEHTVWRIDGYHAEMQQALDDLEICYIADGHHRASAAVKAAELFPSEMAEPDGAPNWIMAVMFPADELQVLPYHRLVGGVPSADRDAFLRQLCSKLDVRAASAESTPARGECNMYLNGQWHCITLKPERLLRNSSSTHGSAQPRPPGVAEAAEFLMEGEPVVSRDEFSQEASGINAAPADQLDVAILQQQVLAPLLGIEDPRADERIRFVGGIHSARDIQRMVDSGQSDIAFIMHPVMVDDVMDVADCGGIMPPKSTWFEPKLRSGLFVHSF